MNENINLCEILKDCPKGTRLYSPAVGEVIFEGINDTMHDIITNYTNAAGYHRELRFSPAGQVIESGLGECMLFPSRTERDWTRFDAPWQGHVYYIVRNKDKFYGDALEAYQYEPMRIDGRWRASYNDPRGGTLITRSSSSNYLIDEVTVDDESPASFDFKGSFDEFIDYHTEKAKKWGKKFFLLRDSAGALWITTSQSDEYQEKITDNPNFLSNIHCQDYYYPIDSAGYYFDGVVMLLRDITKNFNRNNPYSIKII